MTPGQVAPFSLRLVTTCTVSGKSGRMAPTTTASLGLSAINKSAYCEIAANGKRRAVPFAILHADPSLFTDPSGPSEIHLVSGPLDLVKMTISKGALMRHLPSRAHHSRRGRPNRS